MFRSFFKTAFRFFWRNKKYTILNYLCLSFGLTCAIVATLNINHVFRYDKFHVNYDQLHEVNAHVTYFNGDCFPKAMLSASLIDKLKENVPEIDNYSRVVNCSYQFESGNELIPEDGIYAEPGFLDIFTFPLLYGSSSAVLADNNSIVISERMAIKFFKTTDCIGKSIILKEDSVQTAFIISGILKNVPAQSYLQFNFIIPFSKYLTINSQALEPGATACQTWVLLNSKATAKAVNEEIKDLIRKQETTLNQELFLFQLKEKILYSYALYLSSSKPVEILNDKNRSHSFSFFRQGLIVFQFTIPVVLIIIVLIIKAQDSYMRNFDLGFDKEKMIIFYNTQKIESHSESIRTDLLSLPGIESASFTNCIPSWGAKVINEVSWEGKDAAQELHFWFINTDYSYDKIVNLKITDGRYFDRLKAISRFLSPPDFSQSWRAATRNPVEALRYE